MLVDEAEAKVREIIETASKSPEDDEQRKIGDLYASFMDEDASRARRHAAAARARAGRRHHRPPWFIATLGELDRQGVGSVFGVYIGPDSGNPERYITHLNQGGTGLPDQSYYREDGTAAIRKAYVGHLTTMLGLAGLGDAADRAQRIMDLETGLRPSTGIVSPHVTPRRRTTCSIDGLEAWTPPFDWSLVRRREGP